MLIASGLDNNLIGGTRADGAQHHFGQPAPACSSASDATDNVVQGNYIGTDVTGCVDVGSDDLEGVKIDDSPDNLIGGSVPARAI